VAAEPQVNPNAGNEAMVHVKAMLRWGEEVGLCDLPFRRFPRASHVRPGTRRITDADVQALLSAAAEDFRDMLVFGLLTGLRPQELRELRQDQIRFTAGGEPHLLIERHKTSRSAGSPRPRSVPLCPLAEEILERRVRANPQSALVFLNAAGGPYTRYSLRNRLRRLCRRVGLKDADGAEKTLTPYSLRHTFASLESDAGIESTALAGLMGHSTTRTLDRYVSNTYEHHRKAVGAVESRIKGLLPGGRR
jgi:integrase